MTLASPSALPCKYGERLVDWPLVRIVIDPALTSTSVRIQRDLRSGSGTGTRRFLALRDDSCPT